MVLGFFACAKGEEEEREGRNLFQLCSGDVRQGETGSASIGGRRSDGAGLSPSLAIPPPEGPRGAVLTSSLCSKTGVA